MSHDADFVRVVLPEPARKVSAFAGGSILCPAPRHPPHVPSSSPPADSFQTLLVHQPVCKAKRGDTVVLFEVHNVHPGNVEHLRELLPPAKSPSWTYVDETDTVIAVRIHTSKTTLQEPYELRWGNGHVARAGWMHVPSWIRNEGSIVLVEVNGPWIDGIPEELETSTKMSCGRGYVAIKLQHVPSGKALATSINTSTVTLAATAATVDLTRTPAVNGPD